MGEGIAGSELNVEDQVVAMTYVPEVGVAIATASIVFSNL
jgi:hypothetical protein